jgi:hypothetical protein
MSYDIYLGLGIHARAVTKWAILDIDYTLDGIN